MRHKVTAALKIMNAAVAADGWISLFDVDMEAFVPRVPASPTVALPDSNMVSGVGKHADAWLHVGLKINSRLGGNYVPATWPIYALVRCAYGEANDNHQTSSAEGDFFDVDEVIMHGSQAMADLGSPNSGMQWFNFFPRGRINRFGFQVEPGTGALADFDLFAELWVVTSDGR